jgi:hypothetical protein
MVWLLVASILIFVYSIPVRRWFTRWGATAADRSRAMPGDRHVPDPTYQATLAVTVAASPEDIWPWLVQMGYRRGGLYSYDWLDRLFGYLDAPSATRVLPQWQHLNPGDEIPIGRAGGFPISLVDPPRALVLAGEADGVTWVWQFGIYAVDAERTRLVSRNAVRTWNTIGSWLFMRVIEPAAFLMTRRMLLGIRQRAEQLAHERRSRAFLALRRSAPGRAGAR